MFERFERVSWLAVAVDGKVNYLPIIYGLLTRSTIEKLRVPIGRLV